MPTSLRTARTWLGAVLLFAFVFTGVELVLLEHYDDWRQRVPLALLAIGVFSLGVRALRPSRLTARLHAGVMASYVAAGLMGLYFHYRGNVEFELERTPELAGLALMRAALEGATPSLAPGVMVQFGLLGLLFAYLAPAHAAGDDG